MRRTVSISHLEVDGPPVPARFTKIFHVCQEDMITATILHHQSISNVLIYVGIWCNQWIHEKRLQIHTNGTDKTNWGTKFNLYQHKNLLHRPPSTNFTSFSTMDCFDIAYCIHRKVTKQKIGGWIDFRANPIAGRAVRWFAATFGICFFVFQTLQADMPSTYVFLKCGGTSKKNRLIHRLGLYEKSSLMKKLSYPYFCALVVAWSMLLSKSQRVLPQHYRLLWIIWDP